LSGYYYCYLLIGELLFFIRSLHHDAADIGDDELAGSTMALDVNTPCALDELSTVLLTTALERRARPPSLTPTPHQQLADVFGALSGSAECVLCQRVEHVDTVDEVAVVDRDVETDEFDDVGCG